ncbi:MAG: DUF177 domain-containing protein [Betaproteobacteria bacterium]|jgi:uncharacterized protein|nr:DUF177 domain-containing protein [Betaproteobacteria bacterium]NBX90898.1 DUF177 domain-containing protein [Betaproteobacteria bacterium]
MEKNLDFKRLDILAFARAGATAQGLLSLADLARLSGESMPEDAAELTHLRVTWRAIGECKAQAGAPEQVWLHLSAKVTMPVQCQRCLTAVQTEVLADRSFRFVSDEASAEAQDDEAEEDLLVLSQDLDVVALLEDELILSLPLVPRHVECPQALPASASDAAFEAALQARPKPFAALADWKKEPKG